MANINVSEKNANTTFLILYSITFPKMYSFKNLKKFKTKIHNEVYVGCVALCSIICSTIQTTPCGWSNRLFYPYSTSYVYFRRLVLNDLSRLI